MRRLKETRSKAAREFVSPALVQRCQAGDEAAWHELVEATYREVYSLCLRVLRDPDDAAEATQDAYVKVWRSLKGFRGDAMFTTWLYRVAANTAISKQRSRKRRRARETTGDEDALKVIAEAVEAQLGVSIDRHSVDPAEAIRHLGIHEATVSLTAGLEATLTVEVEAAT